ncbi:hypothetical protein GQX74_007713 [Glossina fuscipes]|nr:hypothetical protein GQX74_007713 [Glossina fuscipes]
MLVFFDGINKNLLLLLCISVCKGYTRFFLFFFFNTFLSFHDLAKVFSCLGVFFQGQVYTISYFELSNEFSQNILQVCYLTWNMIIVNDICLRFTSTVIGRLAAPDPLPPTAFVPKSESLSLSDDSKGSSVECIDCRSCFWSFFGITNGDSTAAMVGDSLWLCFEGVEVRGGLGGVCRDRSTGD